MAGGLWPTFLSALQAALSVLLTIFYGVLVGQFGILDQNSTSQMSKLCVSLFLPALLMTSVGSELKPENVTRYAAIVIWSLVYTFASLGISYLVKKVFKLPSWFVVSTAFNNTTSMPLLLTQTLAATGILKVLLQSDTDTVGEAVARAQSYFLANALCGNVTTFTLGPKILDGPAKSDEDAADEANGHTDQEGAEQSEETSNERTSLLPGPVVEHGASVGRKVHAAGQNKFSKLPQPVQNTVHFLYSLLNPPLIGGFVGAVVGLVPPLHRAFFGDSQNGGIFNAWFTTSVQNVGDLFAALQIIVVGVRLSRCLRLMVRGEDSGKVPWSGAIITLLIRYVIWPLISIAVIYLIQTRTNWLSSDPILPFAMMLMPCGPSAMNLTALTDYAGSSEKEKMSLVKFLTISYAFSPLLAFAVVGSVKATQASIG